MFVRRLKDCRPFTAGDGSILRELLHPEKTDLQIRYSLAHAKVTAGQRSIPHKLKACEVYYIMAGQGLMHIDEESFEIGPECAVYIPPNSRQCVENTGTSDLEFLCIVDPAWQQEDERILDT
ncbi:MAG: mannose-6-phosphate isomerase [Phycisphaerae bacterium SM1_79]|nr:MAG: mannose-6-phosphate isomerase [Phycisphaerae bacterium SM1_79]